MLKNFKDERILILAPLIKEQKGEHIGLFEELKIKGYVRLSINGQIYDILDLPKLEKNKKHNISIVVDRTSAKIDNKTRLVQSIETSLAETNGLVDIMAAENHKKKLS